MWTAIISALASLFKWAKERVINRRLKAARQAGADAAVREGSQQVDELILEAERANSKVSDAEDAILNDPANRARPDGETQ